MNTSNYYILRHGETFATSTKTNYGNDFLTADIIPEGIPSIIKIGEFLRNVKSDYNISSKIKRCIETSKIVSDITGFKFSYDERLNDALFDLKTQHLITEPFENFNKRINSFYEEIQGKNYKNIVICTHGCVIAALKSLILENKLEEIDLLKFPKPGVLTIIRDNKKIEEIDFNQT